MKASSLKLFLVGCVAATQLQAAGVSSNPAFLALMATITRINLAVMSAAQNPMDDNRRAEVAMAYAALPISITALAQEFFKGRLTDADYPAVRSVIDNAVNIAAANGYQNFSSKQIESPSVAANASTMTASAGIATAAMKISDSHPLPNSMKHEIVKIGPAASVSGQTGSVTSVGMVDSYGKSGFGGSSVTLANKKSGGVGSASSTSSSSSQATTLKSLRSDLSAVEQLILNSQNSKTRSNESELDPAYVDKLSVGQKSQLKIVPAKRGIPLSKFEAFGVRMLEGIAGLILPSARAEDGQLLFGAAAITASIMGPIAASSGSYWNAQAQMYNTGAWAGLQRDLAFMNNSTQLSLANMQYGLENQRMQMQQQTFMNQLADSRYRFDRQMEYMDRMGQYRQQLNAMSMNAQMQMMQLQFQLAMQRMENQNRQFMLQQQLMNLPNIAATVGEQQRLNVVPTYNPYLNPTWTGGTTGYTTQAPPMNWQSPNTVGTGSYLAVRGVSMPLGSAAGSSLDSRYRTASSVSSFPARAIINPGEVPHSYRSASPDGSNRQPMIHRAVGR